MIEAIVYSSKCGHTLAYAKELAGQLNLPYYSLKKAKKYLKRNTSILYMSWIKEDKVIGYDKACYYHIESVAATGIFPNTMETAFRIKEYNQIYGEFFYLPGGINKKRLNLLQRIILKSIENTLSFKLLDNGLTKQEAKALEAILHNLDYSDFNELEPLIEKYKREDTEIIS